MRNFATEPEILATDYLLADDGTERTPLLIMDNFTDKEIMVEMQRTVYPLYEILENQTDKYQKVIGRQGLIRHLEYVHKHKLDYSDENKPKYLRKAIKDYLKNEFDVDSE